MNVLFVHNNFPAQFLHAARAGARSECYRRSDRFAHGSPLSGVKLTKYALPDADVGATHPFARRFDLECRRGEQVMYALTSLQAQRFRPDVVAVHPGWGESLPAATHELIGGEIQ